MITKTYKCAVCGGIFDSEWTDEEAEAERQKNFGGEPKEDDALVCDDCYKEIIRQLGNPNN
jgi:DNA-directed RNA polymerase subunit RPC12/RpoP